MILTICHNFVIGLPDEQLAWRCIGRGQKQGCRAGRDSRGGSGTLAPPSKDQNDDGIDDRDYDDNIGAVNFTLNNCRGTVLNLCHMFENKPYFKLYDGGFVFRPECNMPGELRSAGYSGPLPEAEKLSKDIYDCHDESCVAHVILLLVINATIVDVSMII